MSLRFDTRVAAAATAQDPKLMRQEFSRVLHMPAQTDGLKRHRLRFREVLYFKLKGTLEREGLVLSPEDRRALYKVLTIRAGEVGGWRRTGRKLVRAGDVPITLDLTNIVRSTHSALRTVLRGEDLIESRSDVCSGEPVFKGTRVPVVHLIEQFRTGVPFPEIAEDYPQLSEKALRYAELRSRMGQAPGRPPGPLKIRRTATAS
ncbi:DUF433 domain-containing protein [Thiocapsa rosea]|uniref:Uncharacterized protein (DUF433 family) n=1 Tax=Thiocapsa rosea TaxID=69360 RepID=A0A495V8F5_9GAMM|nr:DUF433 domain-containing protein [Thiocapsa rosea]RKT45589.1 uncharacterized protein (DUF433 family) [Thiocapsa rosea]